MDWTVLLKGSDAAPLLYSMAGGSAYFAGEPYFKLPDGSLTPMTEDALPKGIELEAIILTVRTGKGEKVTEVTLWAERDGNRLFLAPFPAVIASSDLLWRAPTPTYKI